MQTYGECPRCRAAVPPSAPRCPSCGAGSPPANPGRGKPGPRIPAVPNARRAGKKSNIGLILLIVAGVSLGLAGGLFALTRVLEDGSASDDDDEDGDGKGKKKKKKKKKGSSSEPDAPEPSGEVAIPASAANHRINPSQLSRGDQPQLKDSAKDVELASEMSFDPANDPYCKAPERFADVIKDAGYNIDQELRKTAAMSDAEEEKIGDELFQEVLKSRKFVGKIDTPDMADYRRYITELAVPLLISAERKGIVYDFHTINDGTVNAFAIPGGHIFFHRGLLEAPRRLENEAQLAGILAHEINHVDRRHTIAIFEYLKRFGGGGDAGAQVVSMARNSFSTTQEDEADAYGLKFLIKAEYSPKQVVRQWQNWAELETKRKREREVDPLSAEFEEFFKTHSNPTRRACNVMRLTMKEKALHDRYYVGTSNYQQKRVRARQQN